MGWDFNNHMEILWVNLVKHGLVSLNLINQPKLTIGLVSNIYLVFASNPIIGATWVGGPPIAYIQAYGMLVNYQ